MRLEKKQIISTAIELLDADGLEGVTLRKLATLLKVEAPALYWHFESKAVLIDEMAEAILQEQFAKLRPRDDDEPWDEWLTGAAGRLRKAMLAHRDGARVVVGAHIYPAVTLGAFFEVCLQSLVSAGISLDDAHDVVVTVVHFTFGRAIEEQSGPSPEEVKALRRPDTFAAFQARFPLMSQAVSRYVPGERHAAAAFQTSLALILDGAKARAAGRSSDSSDTSRRRSRRRARV